MGLGGEVILVNPRDTSQICSGCGALVKKGLSVRMHVCPLCDLELDRDVNASRNILARALTVTPAGYQRPLPGACTG